MSIKRIIWFLSVIFMTTMALDAAFAVESIERVDAEGGVKLLLVRGPFASSDTTALLESEAKAFTPRFVTFNSSGGDVEAAIRFGRIIRALGLRTIQTSVADCSGACVLAFVGGTSRYAGPEALGVNWKSFMQADDAATQDVLAAQKSAASIVGYLFEMGVDPSVFTSSLDYRDAALHRWSVEEMTRLHITTATTVDFSSLDKTTDDQIATTEAKPVVKTPEARVTEFARRFHEGWSRDTQQAIWIMEQAYQEQVDFYGKSLTRAEVMDEKWNFVTRWPVRAYWVKRGSEKVACSDMCSFEGKVDWYAYSEPANSLSSGIAQFSIIWNPATNRIVAEKGKVIKADKKAKTPSRIIADYNVEDGLCRGGSGDAPETIEACDRRGRLATMLERASWCHGKIGEPENQRKWHRCEFSSIRNRTPG